MKKLVLSFVMMGISVPAFATNLYSVYQQALQNDPVLKQAEADRDANREAVPQSRAGLLPDLSATGNTTSVHSSPDAKQSAASNGFVVQPDSVNRHSYTLSLTQPLFNFQSWMQLRASKNSAKEADATYNAALQDLMVRVSTAYFNVLKAQDNARFIAAQKKAVADQLNQIRERFQVGMATMTDVYQAKANYDSLNAQEISAENNVANSFEALRQITGVSYTSLDPLEKTFPLVSPTPADPQKWVDAAQQNNWTLLAARFGEQAAKENIRVNYAGHFPVVNAVGQYQSGGASTLGLGSGPTDGTTRWQSNVGVQVSVPLFQGGYVLSKTRQAEDQYLSAGDKMEQAHRQVVLQSQESFNNVMAGISKVEADRTAVLSAQSALESTDEGYNVGTKTILDVLTAEQNLYQVQATLAADQYDYLINTLTLKQAAGSLSAQDIVTINHWLAPVEAKPEIVTPVQKKIPKKVKHKKPAHKKLAHKKHERAR